VYQLTADLKFEGRGKSALGSGYCKKCKRKIIEHAGETCLFDFTELTAPPLERVIAALWQGDLAQVGRMTLEIPGGPSIQFVVRAQTFRYTTIGPEDYGGFVGQEGSSVVEIKLIGLGE